MCSTCCVLDTSSGEVHGDVSEVTTSFRTCLGAEDKPCSYVHHRMSIEGLAVGWNEDRLQVNSV